MYIFIYLHIYTTIQTFVVSRIKNVCIKQICKDLKIKLGKKFIKVNVVLLKFVFKKSNQRILGGGDFDKNKSCLSAY